MDLTVKPPDLDHKSKDGRSQDGGPPMATIHDDDELLLARIGYKQVHTLTFSEERAMGMELATNSVDIRNCGANSRNGQPFHMPSPFWEF